MGQGQGLALPRPPGLTREATLDPESSDDFLEQPAAEFAAPLLARLAADAVPELTEGDRLGPYTIERLIGYGGTAAVYLAHDPRHDRHVALKVLSADLIQTAGRARFHREIRITAGLQHPHILPVFDSGETGGSLWYAMPYVAGESLRGRLARDRRLPLADAIRIAHEVALALDYAHRQGIVHRDVKPENILLADGQALVADFGIARAMEGGAVNQAGGTAGPTETSLAIGTPTYMSPEQAAGDRALDGRSDVYSLGCILFEMLAGQPPFTGPTPQAIIAQRLSERAPAIQPLREEVPEGLGRALDRALARDRADRFASAAEFGAALAERSQPATAPARRVARPWAAGLGAAVLTVAIVVLWLNAGRGSATLDSDAVVILPFRVTGADPAVAYLREGMVDLLAAKLTGEAGPRAVDPRTAVAAWRRVAGSREEDLSQAAALGVARRLGAGQVVLGEVVGRDARLIVAASVLSVADGRTKSRASVQGPVDSLTPMADQLASQLLGLGAGEDHDRLAALTSISLPALRAYLAGRVVYRRGLYREALGHFQRALQEDSTFALAALNLMTAALFVDEPEPMGRGQRLAWTHRERLGARDQVLLRGMLGLRYPSRRSAGERLADWEAAVVEIPDQPEAWFHLGEQYYHFGAALGLERAEERAADAFRRAVTLDSSFAPPLEHLVELAARESDTMSVRRLGALYLRADSAGDLAGYTRWRIATALGDSARLRAVRAQLAAMSPASLERIIGAIQLDGLPPDDAEPAKAALHSAPGPAGNLWRWGLLVYHFELNRGHPATARQVLESLRGVQPNPRSHLWLRVMEALYGDGDSAAAAGAVRVLQAHADAPLASADGERRLQSVDVCLVELWRLRHGDTRTAARAIAKLRSPTVEDAPRTAAGGGPEALPVAPGACAGSFEAILAKLEGRVDSPVWLARLDSVLSSDLRDFWLNLEAARLHEAAGDLQGALEATRRRPYWWQRTAHLASFLREEGRLAALAGDRVGAIRAYRHYLALRPDPDPAARPRAEQVRAELSKLLAEARGAP